MVRLGKPVSDEYECEVEQSTKKYVNLVRPCERYQELYKTCKSIRSRLYQYYIYGEQLDCKPHRENFKACLSYRKTKDENLLNQIIEWERDLIHTRLMTVKQNKTWDLRESPPENFDGPLPKFIAERQRKSWFLKSEEKTGG